MSLVFDTNGHLAVAGEELLIAFTVINETREPAVAVTLTFGVNEPNVLVFVRSDRGTCEGSACDLGLLDGHESVTGNVVVLTKLGFNTEIRVDADLSWPLKDSTRRHSLAQAKTPLAETNQPGAFLWTTPTDSRGLSCSIPVPVDDEAIYAGFGSTLYAVSKSNGDVLWLNDQDGPTSQPILAGRNLYFGTVEQVFTGARESYIGSLRTTSGTQTWRHRAKGAVRGPIVVYGGNVFYTENGLIGDARPRGNYLVSLNASDGLENWRYRVDKWIGTSAVESGDNIYFGTYAGDDYLYAINPNTGALNRRYQLTAGGSFYTPLIVDGNAYIPSRTLYSMDLSSGRVNWEYRPEGGWPGGTPIFSDGSIYLLIYGAEEDARVAVHAIDADTGSLKWEYKPGQGLQQPTVFDGNVYVPSYSDLVSLDASTGIPNWQAAYSYICGPVTATDGVLYGRASYNNRSITFAIRTR